MFISAIIITVLMNFIVTEEFETRNYSCVCELCEHARLFDAVTSAGVKIRFPIDELMYDNGVNEYVDLSAFADYHTFAEEPWYGGMRTLFTTDITVSDFRFLSLVYDDYYYVIDSIVLFSLNELTPEMPLLAEWNYMGCFTSSRAISFVYGGETRYFEIVLSNCRSHLYLAEFLLAR
jgi:hypothetical protein